MYRWRAGPDPLSSGEPDRLSEAQRYRIGFKTAIAAGALYGGYRLFGGALAGALRTTAATTSRQARLGYGLVRGHLQQGRLGQAAWTAGAFATAPFRHAFGGRGLAIAEDLGQTAKLLYEGSIDRNLLLEPFVGAQAPPSTAPLRRLLFRDILDLPRGHAALEVRPHFRDTLAGSFRQIRGHLGAIRRRVGEEAFQSLLDVPVDPMVLRTKGGRILDLRTLNPRHAALDVWERFTIPESLSFRVPERLFGFQVPLVGGEVFPLGGAQPLRWLSQLVAPTELLRRQPIQRVMKGLRDAQGREGRFLYSAGRVRPFEIQSLRTREDISGFDAPVPRRREIRQAIHGGFQFQVRDPIMENAWVASATSPAAKGARIRTGQYQHSLTAYLDRHQIAPESRMGRILARLDELGIGPHLTSPQVIENESGRLASHAKAGALERLYRWTQDIAYGSTGEAGRSALVAGETSRHRFVPYIAEGGIAQAFGTGAAGKTIQHLSDFANYSVLRPLQLFEEMVGLGVRGGTGPVSSLWRILSRVVIPGYFIAHGLKFSDFVLGEITGKAPSDALLDAYTGLQVGRARGLEAIGAQGLARRLEELFPGSVSSPASAITRTVLGGAAGARASGALVEALSQRYRFFSRPILRALVPLFAAGMGGLFLGSDPLRGSESLRRRYSGEELVPIRRSRFWELGRDSYFGRDIMYWRPHAIAMRRGRVLEKSTYGSEAEYWKYGSPLSPLRYLDPYHLERKQRLDRPYPETGPLFGDVPIVGPLLEATLGRILKPVRRHPATEAGMALQGERWGGDRRVPEDAAARLGIGGGTLALPEGAVSRFRPGQVAGKAFNHVADWLGMQGFLWKTAASAWTGTKSLFGGDRQLETSDRMAGAERWYYGMELGGGFQTYPVPGAGLFATEFTRRLIPHRDRSIELVNPIPNRMPDWLPGPRSAFEKDRSFYLQGGFHLGDPYSKLAQGEARLPGKGYEAVRPLHSGVPGVYDPVDRLLILEDVAPYSEAAKHYRAVVNGWVKAGVVDDHWKRQILESRVRRDERERSKQFGTENRFAEPGLEDLSVTISKVTSPTTFRTEEYPFGFRLAGIETKKRRLYQNQLESGNAKTLAEAEATVKTAQKSLREKLEGLVGQTVRIQVARDQAARYQGGKVLSIVPGVSEEAARGALADPDQGGIAAYLQGGWGTRRAANLYYGAATALNELPGPLRWPLNKLLPMKDPVEDYFQFQVLSSRFGMWETPYESYLKPWARSVRGYVQDYVPEDLEEKREELRQFQRLRFLKATRNLEAARAAGDAELTASFAGEARRTYLGVNPRSPREAALYARQALEAPERDYLDPFRSLRTTEQRRRALRLMPEEAQYILVNLWRQDMPRGVGFEDEDLSQASRRLNPWSYPAEELREFLETTDVPERNWAGWDPRVSIDAAKVKWVENRGDDIHNYGLWESESRRVGRQFPNLPAPTIERRPRRETRIQENLMRLGLEPLGLANTIEEGDLEIELRKGKGRERGYDRRRRSFEESPIYFPEPA